MCPRCCLSYVKLTTRHNTYVCTSAPEHSCFKTHAATPIGGDYNRLLLLHIRRCCRVCVIKVLSLPILKFDNKTLTFVELHTPLIVNIYGSRNNRQNVSKLSQSSYPRVTYNVQRIPAFVIRMCLSLVYIPTVRMGAQFEANSNITMANTFISALCMYFFCPS